MSEAGNYLYVIRYADNLHKIGFSLSPSQRLLQLQLDDRRRLSIVRIWERPSGDAQKIESMAHGFLADYQDETVGQRERFFVGKASACAAVHLAISLWDSEQHRDCQEAFIRRQHHRQASGIRRGGKRALPDKEKALAKLDWFDPKLSGSEVAAKWGVGLKTLHTWFGPRGTPRRRQRQEEKQMIVEVSVRCFYTSEEADIAPAVKIVLEESAFLDGKTNWSALIAGVKSEVEGIPVTDLREMTKAEVEDYRREEMTDGE